MWQTIIYTSVLAMFTLVAIMKQSNKMGILLLLNYLAIAFFSILSIESGITNSEKITLAPYLFLIAVILICFKPFLKKDNSFLAEKVIYDIKRKYYYFAVVYIIFSLIAMKCYLPKALALLSSGNWFENRNALYSGEQLIPYSNYFEYLAIQFTGYSQILALIVGFVILRNKGNRVLGITLIVLPTITEILNGMITSSRAQIIYIVMILFSMYLFFTNDLGKNNKRFFIITGCLGAYYILQYIIAVTVSRFGSSASSNSFVDYLGQPPLVFNYGVFPITKHLWGEYTLGKLWGAEVYQNSIGGNWGSGLYTFVGWLYIDWGVIGTILLVLLVSFFVSRVICKKEYNISDLYFIFFFYHTLIKGAFVIGRSYIYNILGFFVIYLFVKFFVEKYTFKIGKILI